MNDFLSEKKSRARRKGSSFITYPKDQILATLSYINENKSNKLLQSYSQSYFCDSFFTSLALYINEKCKTKLDGRKAYERFMSTTFCHGSVSLAIDLLKNKKCNVELLMVTFEEAERLAKIEQPDPAAVIAPTLGQSNTPKSVFVKKSNTASTRPISLKNIPNKSILTILTKGKKKPILSKRLPESVQPIAAQESKWCIKLPLPSKITPANDAANPYFAKCTSSYSVVNLSDGVSKPAKEANHPKPMSTKDTQTTLDITSQITQTLSDNADQSTQIENVTISKDEGTQTDLLLTEKYFKLEKDKMRILQACLNIGYSVNEAKDYLALL